MDSASFVGWGSLEERDYISERNIKNSVFALLSLRCLSEILFDCPVTGSSEEMPGLEVRLWEASS